jgi:uncharacterized iron-regulated protein
VTAVARAVARAAARALRLAALSLATALIGCAAAALDIERLREKRFVLLGEVHDNAEQHRQRAQLLRALLADGKATRVVFEQMARTHDGRIAAAPRDADAIADAGRLDRAAWRWPLHKPLVEAALQGGATVHGGNLERDAVRAIVRGGLDAVPADLRSALSADAAWSAADDEALRRLVDAGHCHMLPASQLPAMTLAQRARDAALAQAMLQAPAGTRVVLIAGNGHVRTDLGVPRYLRAAGVPDSQIAAIGFVERGGEHDDAPYDERRTTAAVDRPDPCAALRR